jgi:hypothetical protein
MSLLTLCQQAASELGLTQPDQVVGSADKTAQVLFRLANAAGKHLAGYHDWQALIVEQSFTSLATQEQTGALPSDYDRLPGDVEIWNTSSNMKFAGPTPQRYWRTLKSGIVTAANPGYWRIINNELNILPVMSAGDTIEFEYITANWCEDSDGTGQTEFAADTDTALIDEELFILELVWRFRKGRGFAQYAEDLETCEREKEKKASRDRGTGRLRPEGNSGIYPPPPNWTEPVGQ